MLNDAMFKWKLGIRSRGNDPRCVYSEGLKTLCLLTPLGKKLFLERVDKLKLEEWLKLGVSSKRQNCRECW